MRTRVEMIKAKVRVKTIPRVEPSKAKTKVRTILRVAPNRAKARAEMRAKSREKIKVET